VAPLPEDLVLHPLGGNDLTLAEQLTLFHMVAVVLDPYTYESTWLLKTAGRILESFAGADCRAAFILTCDAAGARSFLGPWADRLMVFCDEDRSFTKALGITEVPAFVHLAMDNTVAGLAQGWDPEEWRPIAESLAETMSWSRPAIPVAGDPVPYAGTTV